MSGVEASVVVDELSSSAKESFRLLHPRGGRTHKKGWPPTSSQFCAQRGHVGHLELVTVAGPNHGNLQTLPISLPKPPGAD